MLTDRSPDSPAVTEGSGRGCELSPDVGLPDRDQVVTLARGWLVAFYLGLALLTGSVSFYCRPLRINEAAAFQKRIWDNIGIQGEAGRLDPVKDLEYRSNASRVLMPAVMAGLVKVPPLNWDRAFSLSRLVLIALTYLAFHCYLRGWFAPAGAMAGTLFVAATVPLTFNNWYEFPTDFPEILTYTLGLWCIRERRLVALGVTIFLGTLNRETAMFLPLIFLFTRFGEVRPARLSVEVLLVGLTWLVPFAFLRWWTGIGFRQPYANSTAHNLPGLMHFFLNYNLFNNYLFYFYLYGVFWVLPFASWSRQPQFLRRALLSVLAFVVVYVFFGGFLNEPREIVNLYPLLVPAGLFGIFREPSAPAAEVA